MSDGKKRNILVPLNINTILYTESKAVMSKKVHFNGIEILAAEENMPSQNLFDFTEEVMGKLGSELDADDQNFHMQIRTDFYPNKPPKHRIYVNGLSSKRTLDKVIGILRSATKFFTKDAPVSMNVNLLVED
jgi:hypothetical protein